MNWPPLEITNKYDLKWFPTISGSYTNFWTQVYDYTNFKDVFEIGFNAGHTSYLLLNTYHVNVTSVDKVILPYTIECSNLLKQQYTHKFNFIHSDSKDVKYNLYKNKFDLIFIDGCHTFDCVINDILLANRMGIQYLVLDDIQFTEVNRAIDYFKNKIVFDKIIEMEYLDCLKNKNKISLYKIINNYQYYLL